MANKYQYLAFRIRRWINRVVDLHPNETLYGHRFLNEQAGADVINQLLSGDAPCMIGRVGCSEIMAVNAGLDVHFGLRKTVHKKVRHILCNNAGFFPERDDAVMRYMHVNIEAGKAADFVAYFPHHHTDWFIHRYCRPDVNVGPLRSLEPYYFEDPWTRHLQGKKVLVVHPFEQTIRSQYQKREKLFENPDILPEFELKTVKAIQSIGSNTGGFPDWFAALAHMKEEIAKQDFDIAILGCGAYAFPLAAFIKEKLGKKVIVLGGATQILFGIKGARWKNHPVISKFFNDEWVRPSETEIPEGHGGVENGCYW